MARIMKINGLPVVDAKDSITLVVTAKDIENAKKKNQAECAAAVACRRQLKASEARVHLGRTYIRFNGKYRRYITSSALRDEIVAFDRGGRFQPGEYMLMNMQPSRQYDRKYRLNKKANKAKRYKKHSGERRMVPNVRPVGIYA